MRQRCGVLWAALLLAGSAAHAQQMPPVQYAELGACMLESGATIESCRLGYRTFGTLDAARDNAVLFPMWFTGRSGDVGALVAPGPGHFVDTSKFFVIVVDPFGNGVSSSPSNSKAQHGTAFPVFTIRDMVRAQQRLVRDTLHLAHLRAVVGESMGGMQCFEWAVDAPAMMDRAVSIVGSPQLTSYDLLVWSAEKEALESDRAYMSGRYKANPALPLVSYLHQMNLSSPEFRVDHTTREQFPEYLRHTGTEMHTGTDANDYLRQLQAVLSQDIAHGGDIFGVARLVQAKMLIINAQQDHMVNPIPALSFAKLIHAQTVVLQSDCGHMAPGCEINTISPVIDQFLAQK
ncbi:alpha/beta fold hydrolase [Acidipila sp. EB88]|uniref:alpha/beta fold hydrolase n=1 Tax=Acidipila sp. EB88 TaxID=2305226 RepID=UPI000F5F1E95|nr:alpha/beta fold hydrolase [Acidipila sp. EB88]RRA47192.1 alpha/beta fold hydrolase [Acidipila sp. EB88]